MIRHHTHIPPSRRTCSGVHRAAKQAAGRFAARWMAEHVRHDGKKLAVILPTFLAACAQQVPSAVNHAAATPGFILGVWHGFIFPVAWVLSLFLPDVAIYAVPNDGGWYDFGFFVGIVFLGVGARSSRTVYRTRVVRR